MSTVDIILPLEAMVFYILNALGHDPALHDFTPSSGLGKLRLLQIFSNMNVSNALFLGGDGDDPPMDVSQIYDKISDSTVLSLIEHAFVYKPGASSKDLYDYKDFIIVHIPEEITKEQCGVAPGFVYTSEKTFSPFAFTNLVKDATGIQHYVNSNGAKLFINKHI